MIKINPLKIGDAVPNFSLLDSNSKIHTLQDYIGNKFIIYFYPRALTPGCTAQACGLEKYKKQINIPILGISNDPHTKLAKFADKYNITFPFLSDVNNEFSIACGVYGEKKFMGRTSESTHRIAFLINEKGFVEYSFLKIKAADFYQEVLDVIK